MSERQFRFLSAMDPDSVLLDDFRELIEAAQASNRAKRDRRDLTAGPLRILLLGYTGAGNTGADIRTIETIRQLRRLFAGCDLELTVFACGALFDHADLQSVRVFTPSSLYFPEALDAGMQDFDVVLNVEGSMYTSKFSDSLAAILIGGVGLAAAHGRVACAYGIDAGAMSARLERFAAATASGVEIVCRSSGAQARLAKLGLATQSGADSAWDFRAADGALPELPPNYAVLCPNNPFWWPVYTDVRRAIELDVAGTESPLRYGPLHFHTWDDLRAARLAAYKHGFAAVAEGLKRRGYAPVLVAMERLDRDVCEEIAAQLPFPVPIVSRGVHSLDAVVATIEQAKWVVTTRYHASVLAIASRVPAIGVSMDARIDQLFEESGLAEWGISCDEQGFEGRVLERIDAAAIGPTLDGLRDRYASITAEQSLRFEAMGVALKRLVDGAA
jgi:polysaccharide pyruvyl transferase WcaK-like protein